MASNTSGRGRRPRRQESPEVKLSKALSYLCRHGASKEGLTLQESGFLFVDDILKLKQFSQYTEKDVRHVVDTNDKKRYALQNDPASERLMIRANQGHTLQVDGLDLQPITDSSEAPVVVHGTYLEAWQFIQKQGLSRMKRNHIHFAPGEPGGDGVISGMRTTCQILVFVDIDRAIKDGYKFFRSANNVILCPGDKNGLLPPKYFDSVIQLRPRRQLKID